MTLEEALKPTKKARQVVGWSEVIIEILPNWEYYRYFARLGTGGHSSERRISARPEMVAGWARADGLIVAHDEWEPVG